MSDEGADEAPDPERREEPSARSDADPADPPTDTDATDPPPDEDPADAVDRARAEEGTADAGEVADDAADAGDGDGDAAEEDASGGIPDDYDPLQPSVDVDYGTHQYPSPADDTEDTDADDGSDPDADDGDDSPDARYGADPDEVTQGWTDDDPGDAGASAAKSDGGYADGTSSSVGEYETPPDEEVFEGPPDDQEMPLADHIEEMVRRLGVVVVVMAVVSGIVFPFGERIINFLWYTVLVSDPVPQPRIYHPLALILARLKVATLAGFIAALPVFVYESYQFMKPGLYPHERRYYLASVPTSLVLATVGVLFAYFLVLPALFTYFLYYSDEVTVIAFGLTETFDLMVLMLGGFAFIFQIPLFVMLAIMMGLTTRQWMADRRLYFWGAFLGLAFLFSPDPTGMAPIIVAATMVVLFEGTLFLLKWTNRGREQVPGG